MGKTYVFIGGHVNMLAIVWQKKKLFYLIEMEKYEYIELKKKKYIYIQFSRGLLYDINFQEVYCMTSISRGLLYDFNFHDWITNESTYL